MFLDVITRTPPDSREFGNAVGSGIDSLAIVSALESGPHNASTFSGLANRDKTAGGQCPQCMHSCVRQHHSRAIVSVRAAHWRSEGVVKSSGDLGFDACGVEGLERPQDRGVSV